jgi:hypothetical protein
MHEYNEELEKAGVRFAPASREVEESRIGGVGHRGLA